MKKLFAILMAGMLIFLCFAPAVSAEETSELVLSAPAAVLMEKTTGKVLFEKNSHETRPCASITKVMTLILTFEAIEAGNLKYQDMLSASAHASSMGGSDIWLKEGESMSVDDLIKATVIMSANDAAVVLAEAVAGSEEAFVIRMNEKAQLLGMKDTVFKNCNGLDEAGHVTSAYDVALMSRELLNYPKIHDYTLTWIDYVRDGATQLVNTNKLIKRYKGITGLKTGTTSQAGSCVTASATRDNMSIISVVLGAPSSDERFSDAESLLNYGFANYTVISPEIPEIPNVPIRCGMQNEVRVKAEGDCSILTALKDKGKITSEVQINEEVEAPIEKGQVIGKVVFTMDGTVVKEIPVKSEDAIEKITFSNAFIRILQLYLS